MNRPTHASESLHRIIEQKLQTLYQSQLGHQPSYISCQLQGTTLVIVIEHPLTKVEQLLMIYECRHLAEQVRAILDRVIRNNLIVMIEKTAKIKVVDLLIDTRLDVNQGSAIAILAGIPPVVLPAKLDNSPSPFNDV